MAGAAAAAQWRHSTSGVRLTLGRPARGCGPPLRAQGASGQAGRRLSCSWLGGITPASVPGLAAARAAPACTVLRASERASSPSPQSSSPSSNSSALLSSAPASKKSPSANLSAAPAAAAAAPARAAAEGASCSALLGLPPEALRLCYSCWNRQRHTSPANWMHAICQAPPGPQERCSPRAARACSSNELPQELAASAHGGVVRGCYCSSPHVAHAARASSKRASPRRILCRELLKRR